MPGIAIPPGTLPDSPAEGQIAVDSGDGNKVKTYSGGAWQQPGMPAAESAGRVLTNADNGKNIICTGSLTFTVNVGLIAGFGCAFKGTVAFSVGPGAVVTDVRTTGATNPWCALVATGTDVYDIVGSKA